MEILFADRMKESEVGIFRILKQKKSDLIACGRKIYDMSIGTPDFPPPPHVVDALISACKDMNNYKYAVTDLPELQDAIVRHYIRRFGVNLSRDKVMSVNGSQDGLAHVCFALCNPGDIVLVPDPGYPIFNDGPLLAGAKIYKYPLLKENNFIADLREIPEDIARKARVIIVSYPMNPGGATAPDEFYKELIEFANKYNVIVIHDNAYSDIVFREEQGKSFLAYEGAEDIGIEFFSLSKTYNMTGARISFAVGNSTIINQFKRLRSQIDYGIFLPIQFAAIAALNGDQSLVKQQCKWYEERGHKLCQGFRNMGWEVDDPRGSMFVWAQIPDNFTSSVQFCNKLMDMTGVICTPGNYFGNYGEGFVRFALVLSQDEIVQALNLIEISRILDSGV